MFNKINRITLLIIIGILILPIHYYNVRIVIADSNVYYVSNNGDNSKDGLSPGSSWRTIGKVTSELNGGVISQSDDVYFNRGDTFTDAELLLRQGGTSGDWMTIGAYGNGAKPVFSGISGIQDATIHLATSVSYIKIQDIDITNAEKVGIRLSLSDISYMTVYNVVISNPGTHGMVITGCDRLTLENCTVTGASSGAGFVLYGRDTGTQNRNTKALNCTVANSRADGFTYHQSDGAGVDIGANHYLYNCKAYGTTLEQGFDITSGTNIYIKDCEAYGNNNGGIVIGHHTERVTLDNFYLHDEDDEGLIFSSTDDCRVRNSIFTTSGNYLLDHTSGLNVLNVNLYNNDFIYEPGTGRIRLYADGPYFGEMQHVNWKNNIFIRHGGGPSHYIALTNTGNLGTADHTFDNNMYWYPGDSDTTDRYQLFGTNYNFNEWTALSRMNGELRQDPGIVDIDNEIWDLESTSNCIDAGAWLTTCNGGGSGTTITLQDANYFFPGLPTLGVPGDNIFIGDDTNLEVIDVDYNAETITVDRSITWNNGDSVSLSSYNGLKVDIGAKESAGTTGGSNSAPTLTNEGPEDTSTGISRYPQLNITVTDADGNTSEVYWYTNASGSWYLMQTNSSVVSGATVRLMNFTNASSYYTKYWWRISADDNHDTTTETYYFTTEPATESETEAVPTSPTNLATSTPTTSSISLEWNKGYMDGSLVHDLLYVDNFTKYDGNPVFDKSDTGSWASYGIRENILLTNNTGYAVKIDGEYVMYFNGRNTSNPPNAKFTRVGRATSSDGVTWTAATDPVFNDTDANFYTFVGSIIQLSENSYRMYYTAKNASDPGVSYIKYATSTDGITWVAQGDLLDQTDFTGATSMAVYHVTYFDSTWHMMMEGTDATGAFGIYYASSSDGINWTPFATAIYSGGPPGAWDDEDAANPSLYKLDTNKYVIFYNGNGNSLTNLEFDLGVLYSTSLTSGWTSWKNNPILTRGAETSWDDERIEGPRLYMDDMGNATLRMWYFGLPTTNSFADGAIGYAICDETITNTMVRYSTSDDLSTYTDGSLGYNGTDSYTTITGLNPDTTYYFRAWSWNETEGWNATGSNTVNENTLNPPTSPVITNINLIESDPLDTNPSFGWINITCEVTDDIAVDEVSLSITNPDGSYNNVFMNAGAGDSDYYNSSTAFSTYGNYSYLILANGTNGNSSTSTVYDFSMPPNWDINKDGQCTILDLTMISNHYWEIGQNGWIPEDIDNNGIVQVLDFIMITGHYGESWWT